MTDGFKPGASSDDPLGNDDDADEVTGDVPLDGEVSERQDTAVDTGDDSKLATDSPETSSQSSLPWIYARNSITDWRDRTVQFHLQASTVETQTIVRNELEEQLDENVRLADLREAALLAGFAHTEDIAATLREWEYGVE